jgi:polar amino acid transport system permease protein
MAAVIALTLGFVMAFARVSEQGWLKWPAGIYVELFRNTPLLIQLYLYYRGLQSVGFSLSPETCGVLALSLYTGAYLTEVFRSGLLAIPQQQSEAGLSLGLSRFNVYRLILIPQALRLILPAIGNQLISLVKNSSLVAFITVSDLFLVIYKGAVDQFKPLEYFLEGAALYISVSLTLSLGIKLIERVLWKAHVNPSALGAGKDLVAPHG